MQRCLPSGSSHQVLADLRAVDRPSVSIGRHPGRFHAPVVARRAITTYHNAPATPRLGKVTLSSYLHRRILPDRSASGVLQADACQRIHAIALPVGAKPHAASRRRSWRRVMRPSTDGHCEQPEAVHGRSHALGRSAARRGQRRAHPVRSHGASSQAIGGERCSHRSTGHVARRLHSIHMLNRTLVGRMERARLLLDLMISFATCLRPEGCPVAPSRRCWVTSRCARWQS
jgi:hypothetical protein